MLYKFKSKATGDLIMLAEHGDHVLQLIGKEKVSPGIIPASDIPAALAALQQAIAQEEIALKEAQAQAQQEGVSLSRGVPITLKQRVFPFMEMLQRAQAKQADVVWGV